MSNLIHNLHIKNFKSVRDLSLECERVNIFIGKPNAGKSNILEAISLLGAGYSVTSKFMFEFIRYGKIPQLFTNNNYRKSIIVNADETTSVLHFNSQTNDFSFLIIREGVSASGVSAPEKNGKPVLPSDLNISQYTELFTIERILNDGSCNGARWYEKPDMVKKYDFRSFGDYQEKGLFLHPPHGDNFYFIVQSHPELQDEISYFLKPNGLDLLLNEESRSLSFVQKGEKSLISYPLIAIPDTFQRYIFHLAAIMSNRDSVLLFEEPESHSYAPYVYQLAQHILNDEGRNQYFITTHSPYFLLPMMQEGKDVAVFATWFEDYQTHARRLSEGEIREMLDYGVDVFLNLDQFTNA